ncbi:predicted protein [Pyrenophora tritici-repentis Pt-1C-BFP]|uniref:Uncharacterized protein n=1 Tax=Pyrenophora tritici-repentis (strain Pt-1C-BFP) TaxID=426418 RepID=B2WHW8_PYRTR|nr:uncharacterized protein PTRG_09577 [Pyrenophora tritici-repentis Pt-1C-BFP]EDU42628.1 predicted protein [Pyrenophora tritici-repentis Pt-1C-BFP]
MAMRYLNSSTMLIPGAETKIDNHLVPDFREIATSGKKSGDGRGMAMKRKKDCRAWAPALLS